MNKGTEILNNNGVATPHAEEQQDTEMVRREPIDGDIEIVEWEGKHFAILGMHKISKDHTDKEELIRKIKEKDYEILIGIMGAVITTANRK